MTVYEDGYYCPVCNKTVKAKIAYNKDENDSVAYCTICGAIIQRVIPKPFSKAAFKPLGVPGHIDPTPETMPRQTQERRDKSGS